MSELLEQILERHGGLDRWRAKSTLTARLSFGGLAFMSRFKPTVGHRERDAEVSIAEPKVIFEDYPRPGQRGVFTADRVWIEADGRELQSRDAPRAAFASLRRSLWWDPLDLLYFSGYALWNYLCCPFLLAHDGVETEVLEPWQQDGETWHRLRARFDPAIPTHCREQVFYFDSELRERRHDYDPEVFASWATAAHYCSEHRQLGGFLFPTQRKVVPRKPDGTTRPGPTLVWIHIADVRVE